MCFPFALAAPAMMSAATTLSTAATLISGVMTASIGLANAEAFDAQAELRLRKGEFDAAQALTRFQRHQGQNIANVAATGLSLTSFADVFADSAISAALERKAIRWGATNEANALRFQADSQRANAIGALVGSVFSAGGQFLSGTARAQTLAGNTGTAGTGAVTFSPWSTTVNPNFTG